MVSVGGTTFPWASAEVIGLGVATVVAVAVFLLVEQKAAEPILPPRLFKNDVFVSAGIVALLVGLAMFGAIAFLPLYFQVVKGASPTGSGLQLLPLMAGLLLTSVVGGQIVSKTGRYRIFPIAGTAVMAIGLFLLSRLTVQTSTLDAAAYLFVTGLGIGLVMQVLVVAVQNAVGYEDLGVATAGNTLFRNIGSSVGTAVIGTIFASELATRLRAAFPHAPSGQTNTSHLSAAALAKLPPQVHSAYLDAFAASLDKAFKVASIVSIVAFVASWFIKELPMRTTVTAEDIGEAFAMPRAPDSLAEIVRALGVLVGRKQMRAYLERVATEAGIDLPLADCWLLVRLRREPNSDLVELANRNKVPLQDLEAALADLASRGLIAPQAPRLVADGPGGSQPVVLTPAGVAVADQIIAAVRTRLERLLAGWTPEQYPDLVQLLNTLATEVIPATPTLAATSPAALTP
jgi:DNA-binding MarR family transcriptional regulator